MLHLFSNPIVSMAACAIVVVLGPCLIIKYRHKNNKNHFALPLIFVSVFVGVIVFVINFLMYTHPDDPYWKNPNKLLVYGPAMSMFIAIFFTGLKAYRNNIIPEENRSNFKKAFIFLAIVILFLVTLVTLIEFKII